MTTYHDLAATQRDVLHAVAANDGQQGTAYLDALDRAYSDRVRESRLYRALDTLVGRGFVDKERTDSTQNRYWLTPAGEQARAEYFDWLERLY